jgi:hypothetical protein
MTLTITNVTPFTLGLMMPVIWSTTSSSGESNGGWYVWPPMSPSGVGAVAVNPQWQSAIGAWCTKYGFNYTLA